ncbi:DNA polymerase III subunit delta [Bacteroidia bacterium]|nr:DNA polymerase III subunit delta [Bacteroidia bacterium]
MEYKQIIENLQNKVYHPIYLLSGEEPYFIDRIVDYLEHHVLTEDEKEFNQTVLYGMDTDTEQILSAAKQYPLMSERRVVIVKEAQILDSKRDSTDRMADYANNPVASTVLVIAYRNKKFDKRKVFYKKVDKVGVTFDSEKLKEAQVPTWINKFVEEKGFKIAPKSTALLVEFLGDDLNKIVNELEKLFLNIPQKSDITPDIIERYIGINKDYNVFELNRSLREKNILKANRIITYFAQNSKENPIHKIIPIIYSFFLKLLLYQANAKKVSKEELTKIMGTAWLRDYEQAATIYTIDKTRRIIGYLREYNVKSLGVDSTSNVEDGEMLKELVFKILH